MFEITTEDFNRYIDTVDQDARTSRGGIEDASLELVNQGLPKADNMSFIQLLDQLPPGSKILELGPGDGSTAAQIQIRYPHLDITVLTTKSTPNFTGKIIQGGIGRMSNNRQITESAFDVVFAHNVIYQLPNQLGAIQDSYRLLKEKGWLLFNMVYLRTPVAIQLQQDTLQEGYHSTYEMKNWKPLNPKNAPCVMVTLALQRTPSRKEFVSSVSPIECMPPEG